MSCDSNVGRLNGLRRLSDGEPPANRLFSRRGLYNHGERQRHPRTPVFDRAISILQCEYDGRRNHCADAARYFGRRAGRRAAARIIGRAPPAADIGASRAREVVASNRRSVGCCCWFSSCCCRPVSVGRFVYETKYNELKAGYESPPERSRAQAAAQRFGAGLATGCQARRAERRQHHRRSRLARNIDGQGSGVIVDKAGYIVTNFHVVKGAETVQVRLSDRRVAEGNGRRRRRDDRHRRAENRSRQSDRRRVGRQRQARSRRPRVGPRQPVRLGSQPDVRHRQREIAPQRQLRQPQPVSGVSANRRRREPRQQRRSAREHRRPDRRNQRGDLRPSYQGISFSIPSAIARETIRRAAREGPHRPRLAGHRSARRAGEVRDEVRARTWAKACSSARSSPTPRPAQRSQTATSFSSGTIMWPPTRRYSAARSPRPKSVPRPSSCSCDADGKEKKQLALDVQVERTRQSSE